MKKILAVLMFSFSLTLPVLADDADMPSTGDLWDNWGASQTYYGQDKSVSDEDFDKAIESLKDKKNKWTNRFKKWQIPKGEEFHQGNETEVINQNDESKKDDTHPVVSLPVELKIGEDVLPIGHYQIQAEKNGEEVFLKFYQSQYLMAQVPAIETDDDFGEDSITFAKWIPEGDNKIKLIFGSMDLNAYTYIDIKK